MNTLLLRTAAPIIVGLMLVFSVFVLLRGHNEPGGGFIGGLIAATAFALIGLAFGERAARRAMHFHPVSVAGAGLLMAVLSGLPSLLLSVPFLTGLWAVLPGFGTDLSTVMVFDIGVYLVVCGTFTSIALALEERGEP